MLVGPMGSGKSTVGAVLAEHFGVRFDDLDVLIAENAGMTVSEIFERQGEHAFRAMERTEAIGWLEAERNGVLALGGGAFSQPSIRSAVLESTAASVYLRVDAATAATRLAGDHSRPLLAGASPRASWSELLQKRAADYLQADYQVDGSQPLNDVVQQIDRRLRNA